MVTLENTQTLYGLVKKASEEYSNRVFMRYERNDEIIERTYLELITKGWQPQQAREVLPLCTATEAVYTAFESDWNHFFDLRYFESTGKVHPNMKELTTLMYKEYENYKKEKRN